ncbi:MAG: BrnA antitoxin family protein [Deltaproteobacteria bacterium]
MVATKPNPYLIDDENPEWTAEDFKNARSGSEVLHEIFSKETADAMLAKKTGRPLGSGVKESQNIRFDRDILASFKATGKGWQTRMNNALREWLKEHPMKPA